MNWLVTGGCGFIGTALIRTLKEEGNHGVRVVDNLTVGDRDDLATAADFVEKNPEDPGPIDPDGPVELVVGDITDEGLALRVAEGADAIVHLAARTGVLPSVEDPRGDCRANVFGTLNFLEAARHNGVERFVFASSGGTVIGNTEPPINEEMAPHPTAPYGPSKLAGEGYCSAYFQTFDIQTVALRFGNVYGPGSIHKKGNAVPRFIQRARNGETLEIYGDGTQTRDYVFIEDLVRAIKLSATTEGVGGETFQIATNAETTVLELIDKLLPALAEAGMKDVEVRNTEARRGEVKRNFADTSKARRMLGWQPETDLDEGLRRTVAWFMGSARG